MPTLKDYAKALQLLTKCGLSAHKICRGNMAESWDYKKEIEIELTEEITAEVIFNGYYEQAKTFGYLPEDSSPEEFEDEREITILKINGREININDLPLILKYFPSIEKYINGLEIEVPEDDYFDVEV